MKEILYAICDHYRELWIREVEFLKEYPENMIAEYRRKLNFAKYLIAEKATIDFENGAEIDLNDLARRIDGVKINSRNGA